MGWAGDLMPNSLCEVTIRVGFALCEISRQILALPTIAPCNVLYTYSMSKKLTKKQAKFIEEYLKPGITGTEAAMRSYDVKSSDVARSMAAENLAKPSIAAKLDSIADRIPDELVAQRINDLLNKKETYWDVDPNTKERKLRRTTEMHVPAVGKGAELALRVKGKFNPDLIPPPTAGNTYNFFYKPEIRKTTDEYEEKLKKLLYENGEEASG